MQRLAATAAGGDATEGVIDRTSLFARGNAMVWPGTRSAKRGLPGGFIGMIALIAAVELHLVRKIQNAPAMSR